MESLLSRETSRYGVKVTALNAPTLREEMERSCRECLASFLNLLQDRFLPPCLVLIFFPSQDNAEQKRRRLDSPGLNSSAEKERKEDRAEREGLEEEDGGSSTPGRLIYLFVVLPMRAGAFNVQHGPVFQLASVFAKCFLSSSVRPLGVVSSTKSSSYERRRGRNSFSVPLISHFNVENFPSRCALCTR